MKRRYRLLISAVCGIAAVALSLTYASSVRAEAERAQRETLERYGGDLVEVCVATRDIEPGDQLDEGNVAIEEWVASLLPSDACTSLSDVAGKVATSRIPQRAVLCPAYTEARGDALEVPDGSVAVSVGVDEEHAVGGALASGDAVEVYVSKDAVADRLTQARVLDTSVIATGGGELSWATLAVEPKAVQELLAAMSRGQVTLAVPGESVADDQEKGDA